MSLNVTKMIWEWSASKGSARLVLLAIGDFADKDGVAWPSVSTLARMTNMTIRNTKLALRTLERSVKELETKIGAGKYGTNLYRVRLEQLARNRTGGEKFSPPVGERGFTPGGEKSCQQGVKAASPKPSIEPSCKPSGSSSSNSVAAAATDPAKAAALLPAAAAKKSAGRFADEPHASRFTYGVCLSYVEATKQGKTKRQMGGLARLLRRTGEEDKAIEQWQQQQIKQLVEQQFGASGHEPPATDYRESRRPLRAVK